ncbi:MAG TPA: tetratricopeptide repeat protein [Methylocaldum sp.]|nr:tetratricopeptide repeat protein [Methylocaldum sp.]
MLKAKKVFAGTGASSPLLTMYKQFLGLFLAMLIPAAAADTSVDIDALLEQGKGAEAFELAKCRAVQEEGDPVFDFRYALAALATGRADLAVFPLERVLLMQDWNDRARLELGRAYFALGEYQSAATQFHAVQDRKPPPNVAARIQQFLDEIDRRSQFEQTRFSGAAELSVGYDTNINSSTDLTSVAIPALGVLLLGDSSRQQEDGFFEVAVSGQVQHALSKKRGVYFQAGVRDHDNFDSNELDALTVGAGGGYMWLRERDRFRVPVQFQRVFLNAEDFRTLGTAGFEWTHFFDGASDNATTFVETGVIRYDGQGIRDVDLLLVGETLTGLWWKDSLTTSLSAYLGKEFEVREEGEHFGRGYAGVRGEVQWRPVDGHIFYSFAGWQFARHHADDPVFVDRREETYVQVLLGWDWLISKSFDMRLEVEMAENNSTLELYEYDRNQARFGVRYRFD